MTVLQKGGVRAAVCGDVPRIAQLWQRVFRHTERAGSDALRSYFTRVFFESPWLDEELPSLVYEDAAGQIVGFIGVIPRMMRFRSARIRAAIATQLMVDTEKHRGFAALELLRRFFAGPQELSFSDGAHDVSQRLWERAGGEVARLYCFEWMRVLRPAHYMAWSIGRRAGWDVVRRLFGSRSWLVRHAISHVGLGLGPRKSPEATARDASIEELLACHEKFWGQSSLCGQRDTASLAWQLEAIGETRSMGSLRKAVVCDASGDTIGWHVYLAKRGGVARVLEWGADRRQEGAVLDCLFREAWRAGACGVSGALVPQAAVELTARRCRLACHDYGVLVQSRDPEILRVIHRGDARLSRLDGEWWLRLGIDRHYKW